MKKPLSTAAIVTVVFLAVITGAIFGVSAGGFSVSGLSAFFVATIIAWVVYALIARAMNKWIRYATKPPNNSLQLTRLTAGKGRCLACQSLRERM